MLDRADLDRLLGRVDITAIVQRVDVTQVLEQVDMNEVIAKVDVNAVVDRRMALFGVRVVRDDGADASGRRAVVRTLAPPLSFLLLGLGFAGILLGGRRRALHDVIAGTAVIYSWDARAARLRYLSRG